MNIVLTGTKVTLDTKNIGFQKDNLTETINVTVDTASSTTYKLDIQYPKSCCNGEVLYNIIDLTRNGDVCSVTLTADMLPFNGKYTCQLRGIDGTKVYHTQMFDVWVHGSLDPTSAYTPVPSEFKQIEDNITELNLHPPKPNGTTGYWDIWNLTTKQYEQSDIPVGVTLPDISETTAGKYLTNDGTSTLWEDAVSSIDGETGDVELKDVKYVAQTLTDAQKAQARTNIGAGTSSFSGDYNDLSNKPTIPTKTSQLDNDSKYITKEEAPVQSVNGKTGTVSLTYTDVNADQAGSAKTVQDNLDAHIDDTENPHDVTAEQVGLGNVDNTSDADKPVSTAQANAIGVVQSNLDEHIDNKSNPHSVTKAQVGLGNVDNTSDANKPVSTAQQSAISAVQTNVDNEATARENADSSLGERIDGVSGRVSTIESEIPSQASSTNQLADKAFVNSSISQSAAFFRGNFATYAALMAVAWQTTDPTAANYVTNNDYAVVTADETHSNETWRYLYVLQEGGTSNGWTAQYKVNNTPFTAAQQAAIDSGVTSTAVNQIGTNKQDIADHEADYNNPHKVTKTQLGLGNVADERQYSAENPPPYPVTSVNGETGAVELDKSDIGLGNVDNVKQYSATNPPPYPVNKVNNKTGDVTLGATDIGYTDGSTQTTVGAKLASLDTNKQDKTDNTLGTTSKTVVGAINELNQGLAGLAEWANALGLSVVDGAICVTYTEEE